MQELLEQYAHLNAQKKAIESQLAELKDQIAEKLPEDGVKIEAGSFGWSHRKNWTYSPTVKALEGKLKDTKKKEEKSGKAVCKVSSSVRFTPKKESND